MYFRQSHICSNVGCVRNRRQFLTLRLDGFPALELWDLIVSVFGNCSRISDRTGKPVNGEDKHHKSQNKIDVMQDIDSVPSNPRVKKLYCLCLRTMKLRSR